jgi:hypothetical protein
MSSHSQLLLIAIVCALANVAALSATKLLATTSGSHFVFVACSQGLHGSFICCAATVYGGSNAISHPTVHVSGTTMATQPQSHWSTFTTQPTCANYPALVTTTTVTGSTAFDCRWYGGPTPSVSWSTMHAGPWFHATTMYRSACKINLESLNLITLQPWRPFGLCITSLPHPPPRPQHPPAPSARPLPHPHDSELKASSRLQ